MTTWSEVRGHHGYPYDTVTRGHFGYWWPGEAAVVVAAPARARARTTTTARTLWLDPNREIALDDEALCKLAKEIAELALKPELRTWVSSVLSEAGRRGKSLETETAIAETVLTEVQPMRSLPLVKTAHLGASLIAVGLHVSLVAHGQVRLTKALVAVYVNGGWRYADPHGKFELGETVPFKVEKFFPIPDLAPPVEKPAAAAPVAAAAPAPVAAPTLQWRDQITIPTSTAADQLMEQILAQVLAGLQEEQEPRREPVSGWRPIHTVVLVSALGIAALALWYAYSREPEEPDDE